jgi:hypothetical protein
MSPLILLTAGEILVFTPLSILASVFFWHLWRDDRTNVLARLLFVMMVTRTVAAVLLAIPTLFFVAGQTPPWSGAFVLLAIDILLPTGVGVAAYLYWLRR